MATTPTTTRHYQRSVPADQHAATRDLMRCVRTNRPDTVDGGPQRLPLPDEKPRLPYLEANLLEALAWPTLKAPHPPTAPSPTLDRITTSWTDLCPAKSNLWVPWAQQHQVTEALISIGDPPMPRRNTALLVDQTAQVRWDMVADNTTNQYDTGNPYAADSQYGSPPGRSEMPAQPIIRDVQARRNTRIENPAHFPQQSAGISQNF